MTTRRKWIAAGLFGPSSVAFGLHLAQKNGLVPPDSGGLYGCGHTLTYAAQRLLTGHANAREFAPNQISKIPHPKSEPLKKEEFRRLQAGGFQAWPLLIDGLVARPATFTLAELKTQPERSQITQLICEEGWSYIARWNGVPLSHLLGRVGVQPEARYAVYRSMDDATDAIDLEEAMHPQTLVTHGMNGAALPIGHGGPLRLRVPKQLGYKSLKFLNRITLTDTLKGLPLDLEYSWYAGI